MAVQLDRVETDDHRHPADVGGRRSGEHPDLEHATGRRLRHRPRRRDLEMPRRTGDEVEPHRIGAGGGHEPRVSRRRDATDLHVEQRLDHSDLVR
jgi:hypothetical protein